MIVGDASGHTTGPETDDFDRAFAALADKRRRQVLRYFQDRSTDRASVAELAEYTIETASAAAPRSHLEMRLHHATLPRLADLNLIEYDADRQEVRYEGCPVVQQLLGAVSDASAREE